MSAALGIGQATAVKDLAEFQIPEDMQAAYGYPAHFGKRGTYEQKRFC